MPLYEPIIPARYAAPLLELVASQQPQHVDALVAACGLSRQTFEHDAILTMAQFDRLLGMASERLGRNDLGFELGSRIDIYSHAALTLAMHQCSTLHELLTFFARYWRLITTCFVVAYRRGPDRLEWTITPGAGMSRTTLHWMEEAFAVSFQTDFARLFGHRRGLEIYLSIPLPPHGARYDALKPTRFYFKANALPQVRCTLPVALADERLGAGWGEGAARGELPDPEGVVRPTPRCSEWVALMLREADGVQPSREMLATLLGLSPRTLSRNLAAEGVDFRRLASEIRLERASTMLMHHTTSVTDIAYRLGYRDVAAFTHAFRKAYGKSPRAYRSTAIGAEARLSATRFP